MSNSALFSLQIQLFICKRRIVLILLSKLPEFHFNICQIIWLLFSCPVGLLLSITMFWDLSNVLGEIWHPELFCQNDQNCCQTLAYLHIQQTQSNITICLTYSCHWQFSSVLVLTNSWEKKSTVHQIVANGVCLLFGANHLIYQNFLAENNSLLELGGRTTKEWAIMGKRGLKG